MQGNPVLLQYFITKVCCKLGFHFPLGWGLLWEFLGGDVPLGLWNP